MRGGGGLCSTGDPECPVKIESAGDRKIREARYATLLQRYLAEHKAAGAAGAEFAKERAEVETEQYMLQRQHEKIKKALAGTGRRRKK
jgi:hypothetical protein